MSREELASSLDVSSNLKNYVNISNEN
jgi:hypothetical protein